MKPGIYVGLSDQEYFAIDAVSRSALVTLAEQSPAHYRHGDPPESDALAEGTMVDLYLTDRPAFDRIYAESPKFDRRTTEGKAAAAAWAEEHPDLKPIDPKQRAMVAGIAESIAAHPVASLLWRCSRKQVVAIWRDAGTGLTCKIKIDLLARSPELHPHIGTDAAIVDLKSCRGGAAHPKRWPSEINKFHYHYQAWFYAHGLREALLQSGKGDVGMLPFLHVAAEKERPYPVSVLRVNDEAMRIGEASCRAALLTMNECLRSGIWPGYSQQVVEVGLPAWKVRQVETEEEWR